MISKFTEELKKLDRHHWVLFSILSLIVILRFPSLFEPFWYGDEGIFAAVARNLNFGGVLYETAWDNKPPMIYVAYASIFKVFGVSMFWLRFVTLVVVLATAGTIYEIARITLNKQRALLATLIFGVMTSLRLIEGNLALTEIYMILPISLAMLFAIRRNFDFKSLFVAGVLIAVASLFKQVGAFEAAALGIYVFLTQKNLVEFVKRGFMLSLGFGIVYGISALYFYNKNLLSEYIFGAYTYYRIYLGESPQHAAIINVVKYFPIIAAVAYGVYRKIKGGKITIVHLFLLWTALSFLGSYFSGRTYGHYLVQATPAVALLLASLVKVKLERVRVIFAVFFFVPLMYLTSFLFSDFLTGGPINQIKYYQNFITYAAGAKSVDAYNDFFDGNVNTIMGLEDLLVMNGARGKSIYIWGDYPWLYAMVDAKNPSRYVTSFHVFGVPEGEAEVASQLMTNPPEYIIKPASSIGYFDALEKLLGKKYTSMAKVNGAEVFTLESQ